MAQPAPLANISFKRPKKDDTFPNVVDDYTNDLAPFCTPDHKIQCNEHWKKKLLELREIAPSAAVLTSTYHAENSDCDSEETETVDEEECNCIPEPLTSLFESQAINFDKEKLYNHAQKALNQYRKSYSQRHFDNLCDITKKQCLSDVWKTHRAGRITASVSKMAYGTNIDSPSKTFINCIMQYTPPVVVAATKYGIEMEPIARKAFTGYFKLYHENVKVTETGLHVNTNFPYLGASPDGLVLCSCHGKGLLEIKCPFKYRENLKGWQYDPTFPISPDGDIRTSHKYYFQMQHQMLVTNVQFTYFYIWSNGPDIENFLIVKVVKDDDFCTKLLEKYDKLFNIVILPELLTRKCHPSERDQDEKQYCICQRPSFLPMISCDGRQCETEWFHYTCVNITRAPKGKWFCKSCKLDKQNI